MTVIHTERFRSGRVRITLGFGCGHFCLVGRAGRQDLGPTMGSGQVSSVSSQKWRSACQDSCGGGFQKEKWRKCRKQSLNWIKDLWNFRHSAKKSPQFDRAEPSSLSQTSTKIYSVLHFNHIPHKRLLLCCLKPSLLSACALSGCFHLKWTAAADWSSLKKQC